MQRSASFLLAAVLVSSQATPAFAYQLNNWPGMIYAPASERSSTPSPDTATGSAVQYGDLLLPSTLDASTVLTRGQFTKMLIDALYPAAAFEDCLGRIVYEDTPHYRLLFSDTGIDHPAAKEICMAMHTGLVRGYDDGTFRPEQPINFAEAGKLLARAFAFTPFPVDPKAVWYRPYADSLSERHLIPQTIANFASLLTAADLKEILYRIQFDVTWNPAQTSDQLQKKTDALNWRKTR